MKLTRRIIAICLIFALLFTLTACGTKPAEEPTEPEPSPSMALDSMLKAIQNLDFETAQQYYLGDMGSLESFSDDSASITGEVVDRMLKDALDFDYTLANEVIDGDEATVDLVFKTYNMSEIFEKVLTELVARASVLQQGGMTADEFQENMNTIIVGIYEDIIKKAEKDMDISLTVNLTKVDGQWMVNDLKDSMDFMNGLTGGLVSYGIN
ncbi:MAG: hypothetical protein IKX81_02755 [Firmicutes bacterium]|nr:hypothetical protein [Bacillota bacterium]